MILSKSFLLSLSFAFATLTIPLTSTVAKQKLDQPAILSSQSLIPVDQIKGYEIPYVAVDETGRIFAEFENHHKNSGPSLVVINSDHSRTPYPGGTWNQWNLASTEQPLDPAHSFVGLAGMTLTNNHYLWVLDNGIDTKGQAAVQAAIKIVQIDIKTNKVIKTYPIPASALHAHSILNTLAVYGHFAYFADKGDPALMVMNLNTGETRRILENSSTLYSRKPIIINHQTLHPESDFNSQYSINQLTLSHDGKRLYYQAASGPLFRLDTMFLNDPTYSPAELNEAMIQWVDTATSGGVICDDEGTLYFTDLTSESIYRFSTGRILTKLLSDSRLANPLHPYVTKNHVLFLPVFKTDSLSNDGQTGSSYIYKLKLPSP